VPETLLEAEFFGVAAGAFTGADRRGREGKFKLADGGTLFLDEIGDMSLALQAKLLRTLQEREFEAVGSNRLESVDVRIIAATSRNLEEMVSAGQFRADLYYRLNVITLNTPALRDRLDDMALLAEYLIEQIGRQQGIPLHGISSAALNRLLRHDWPGNVRELANVLERALLMTDGDVIEAADLDRVMPPPRAVPPSVGGNVIGIAEVVARAEREAILAALRTSHGNKVQAARHLGISRAALYEKIAALGVDAHAA
jgi:transcriptional regulator with PAS, ATPase and Fis domain